MSVLHNIRDRSGQALAPFSARFEAFLAGMTPRDRKLFFGLSMVGVLGVVGGALWAMSSAVDGMQEELEGARDTLAQVTGLGVEYVDAQDKAEELEAKLLSYAGTDLSAFLEQAASSAQIRSNLDSVRETSVSQQGILETKNYSVTIKKASLDQVINFLYEAEGTGYPLRIQSANFKTVRVAGEKHITLKMDVASYRLLEGEEG
jgi:type II secretory pathway component PulM